MEFYLFLYDYDKTYINNIEELPNHKDYYKKLIKVKEGFFNQIADIQFFTIDPRKKDLANYIYDCSTYFKCIVTFDISFKENLKGLNILNYVLESEDGFEDFDDNELDSYSIF